MFVEGGSMEPRGRIPTLEVNTLFGQIQTLSRCTVVQLYRWTVICVYIFTVVKLATALYTAYWPTVHCTEKSSNTLFKVVYNCWVLLCTMMYTMCIVYCWYNILACRVLLYSVIFVAIFQVPAGRLWSARHQTSLHCTALHYTTTHRCTALYKL